MRVHVLRFTYRMQNPECHDAVEEAIYEAIRAGHTLAKRRWGSALIHKSRNEAFANKDQDDCDFLLMVDDDMLPTKEAILQLIDLNAEVASAICTTRNFPVELAVRAWDDQAQQFAPMKRIRCDRPTRVGKYGVGGAFLMIRQDTRQKLLQHYLSARDWAEDNRRMFDRMHVRKELREKEQSVVAERRQFWWDQDRYCRVFDHRVEESQMQSGEDIAFSTRLMQLGIPVTLDGRVVVGHMGEYPYTVADYIPDPEEEGALDPTVGLAERLAG